MKKKRYYKELLSDGFSIPMNDEFIINEIDSGDPLTENEIDSLNENKIFDESYIEFISYYNGTSFCWSLKDARDDLDTGCMRILKQEETFSDGEGLIYFDFTPEDSLLRDFHIVDHFIDEACVGIYTNYEDLKGMHFFEFESQTYPLHVDFDGYLRLFGETKGYFYWQVAILDHLKKNESPTTKNFREKMPQIFPDFDYDKFIELFESLRIDK